MSETPRYPFIRPSLPGPEEWLPFLDPAYAERQFANGGPALRRLEQAIGDTCGDDREAVVVSSGTTGLVATLLALDVRGRVVLPSFTFAATAHAVRLAGCEPVFCEVAEETWELDTEAVAVELERGAAAVLHVRALGLCRDLSAMERICSDANVPLVVDSAAAFGGGDERGAPVGRAGVAEVFSLHATKSLGIGEGGVVVTTPAVATRVRRAINFGFDESGDVVAGGLNGKLSEFAAAVGLAVFHRAPAATARRAAAAKAWHDALRDHPAVALAQRPGSPPWQTFPILLAPGHDADVFVSRLGTRGLQARRYYRPALHRTTVFSTNASLPVTDALSARMVCLPIYADAASAEGREMIEIVLDELAALVTSRIAA